MKSALAARGVETIRSVRRWRRFAEISGPNFGVEHRMVS
jgi:hypothetical protein